MKKKLAVILLSVATVLSVSSSVFAADSKTNVGVQANSKQVTVTLKNVKLPFDSYYDYDVNGWVGRIPATSSTCTPSTGTCSSVTYSGTVYYSY